MTRLHEIQLSTSESIVPGGVRRVSWLRFDDGDWVLISEGPGVRVTPQECGPGTVWARQVVVQLPAGARLVRVESAPKRAEPRDPLAYLLSNVRGAERTTRRSYFTVNAHGKLERLPPPGRTR